MVGSMGTKHARRVAGTVFSDGRPRLIQVKDINLDAEFAPHMLYVVNEDKPGLIGRLGTMLGGLLAVSASPTHPGPQRARGQDAICLVEVDGRVSGDLVWKIGKLPAVRMAKALAF